MTVSVVFGVNNGWAVVWRDVLPVPVQALLGIGEISRFVVDGIFVTFFAVFPRRLFRARWLREGMEVEYPNFIRVHSEAPLVQTTTPQPDGHQ